jgi:hypothetical protein
MNDGDFYCEVRDRAGCAIFADYVDADPIAENRRLTKALEFYADNDNYDDDGAPREAVCGETARAGLADAD